MIKLNVIDKQALGNEPMFVKPIESETDLRLATAYNWYNYIYDPSQSKEWTASFLKRHGVPFSLNGATVPNWIGAVARMDERGIKLPDTLISRVIERCEGMASKEPKKESVSSTPRFFLSSKASNLISLIDAALDMFYDSGYQQIKLDGIVFDIVRGPQAHIVHNYYKALRDELESDDAKEYYDHLSSEQLKSYRAAVRSILKEIEPQLEMPVPKMRKPRKRKEKSPLKITAKVKWCQEFAPLNLKSCHPAEIVGAQSAWLYNTKYNKLTHLKAIGPSGLTIKGSTVLNIGDDSECRKIRKPDALIERVLSGGKVVLRNLLSELKTKPLEPTGRIGSDTVILRVIR